MPTYRLTPTATAGTGAPGTARAARWPEGRPAASPPASPACNLPEERLQQKSEQESEFPLTHSHASYQLPERSDPHLHQPVPSPAHALHLDHLLPTDSLDPTTYHVTRESEWKARRKSAQGSSELSPNASARTRLYADHCHTGDRSPESSTDSKTCRSPIHVTSIAFPASKQV